MTHRARGGPALGTYVSPLCADFAASDADVSRRSATLLFADVSGFTRLGEQLARRGREGAEALSTVISECFAVLLDEVFAHGGDVLRFGGDAMCIGFVGTGSDSATRAVRCAVAMQRTIRVAGRVAVDGRTVRLRMSMGLEFGDLVLVRQPGRHLDVIPVGPLVTQTLALEAAALAGEVIVGAQAAAAIPATWVQVGPGDASAATSGARRIDLRAVPATTVRRRLPPRPASLVARHLLGDALARFLATRSAEYRVATVAFVGITGTDRHGTRGRADALATLVRRVGRAVDEASTIFGVELLATDVAPDGWKLILASGVPDAAPDDETRLLAATRAVVDALGANAHGGIQRGTVFLGAVGHTRRRTITVMGDVVNTAARLMGVAPAGTVVAARGVVERAGPTVRPEWLPPLALKGKRQSVEAAVVHTRAPRFEDRFRRPDDFVGRSREIGVVTRVVRDAQASGVGAVVDVVGTAGVGTSAVVRSALDGVTPVWRVQGDPFAFATPFGALRAPLRWLVGGDSPEGLQRGWRARLRAAAPELAAELGVFAAVVDPSTTPVQLTRSDPAARAELVGAAVAAVVARFAPAGLVVAVDDVQWIDPSSRSVLERLALEADHRGWVLVVARRDDETWEPPIVTRRVPLAPLADAEIRRLVARLVRTSAVDDATIAAVVERSHGNPARARALADAAMLGDDPRSAPDAIEAVPVVRLERASGPARALLADLAVLGMHAPVSVLAALRGTSPTSALAAVRALPWAVGTDGESVWFHNRLVRDVVVGRISAARRRAMHTAVVELAQRRPTAFERGAVVLHAVEAGRDDVVLEHAPRAARRALGTGAVHEAAALFDAALDAMRRAGRPAEEHVALVGELAPLLDGIGRRADAQQRLRWALRHASTAEAMVAVAVDLARSLMRDDRVPEALRVLTATRRRTDSADVASCDRLDLAQADAWMHSGRHRASARLAEGVVERSAQRHDDALHALALLSLEHAYTSLGDPRGAAVGARAITALRATGQWREYAIAVANVAVTADNAGDWSAAMRGYTAAERALAEVGELAGVALVRLNRATIATELGAVDGIEELLADVHRELTALRYPRALPVVEAAAARAGARRGTLDPVVAARCIRGAATRVAEDDELQATFLRVWAVEVDLLAGSPGRARRDLASLRADAQRLGPDTLLPATVERLTAWATALTGRTVPALAAARAAATRAAVDGLEPERCFALALCAAIERAPEPGLLAAQRRLGVVSTPLGRRPEGRMRP